MGKMRDVFSIRLNAIEREMVERLAAAEGRHSLGEVLRELLRREYERRFEAKGEQTESGGGQWQR